MKKIYLTAAGMALSIFGVTARSGRTDVAWTTAALGFALVILLDYWWRERESRRRAERRLLEEVVAAVRQSNHVRVEARRRRRRSVSTPGRFQ